MAYFLVRKIYVESNTIINRDSILGLILIELNLLG